MAAGIAFFDLDRTLLDCNSATLWVRREVRLGFMSRRAALQGASWIALYQTGFLDVEKVLERTIKSLAGQDEAAVVARSRAFWEEEVQGRIRGDGRKVVDEHRRTGHRVVLLTTSSVYLSEDVARHLALDDFLSNRFEVADGRFTGEPFRPLCYGAGKRALAEEYAARHDTPLTDCWFYTDSAADLPALEVVGHPVAVHPDPRLRREAKRRGWPIQTWR
jgi:HAD superfamily hydrolase (TIGR01490 family)